MKADFSYHVTNFLSCYLPQKAGMSINTAKSYRDTFSLLIKYLDNFHKVSISNLAVSHLKIGEINEFLSWLESERGCSVLTRNQRLAAIHSFFRYLQTETPENLYLCHQILAMPFKKCEKKVMNYLSLDGIKLLLEQPSTDTLIGRRDLMMLSLLYDTGARVQILNLQNQLP